MHKPVSSSSSRSKRAVRRKKVVKTLKSSKTPKGDEKSRSSLQSLLQLAQLRSEKCELKEAHVAYSLALQTAQKIGDLRSVMESLSGLLRLAAEALNEADIDHWDTELDHFMAAYPKQIPPMVWHCKGVVANHHRHLALAQRYFLRFVRAVRSETRGDEDKAHPFLSREELTAKGWSMISATMIRRNQLERARLLIHVLLERYEEKRYKGINGLLFLQLGIIEERKRSFSEARRHFQKAHACFLGEHNWYYHLYVLYGYARLARFQQNYAEAYWYLELMDKAAEGPEFGALRKEIALERSRLEQDAVDMLIDSRQCVVKTRDSGQISLRKQYVLLNILEALSAAHNRTGTDSEKGLSKAEIIESVWKESYRPEAHDNKLYYNINRLRKLIEPDIKKPQYLLNWKEGYRLAPGLKVQFIGGHKSLLNTNPKSSDSDKFGA